MSGSVQMVAQSGHEGDARAAIGVFDSGVGGLSVLREIRALLPAEDLLYVADSGAAPYGDRSADFIHERARSIVEFLDRKSTRLNSSHSQQSRMPSSA